MAKDGLCALLCAGALFGAAALPLPRAAASDDGALTSALAVQAALQQGRELLLRGNYRAAVYVLESQISRIDGSREYLAALRDAYRGYVRELKQSNQEAEAQVYLRRLQALDPGAALDFAPRPAAAVPEKPKAEKAAPAPTVRLQKEEDPFSEYQARQGKAKALAERADQEFHAQHYDEAARLYEQAQQADPDSTKGCLDRWAYCKLHGVVQRLNQPAGKSVPYPELEKEVRLAMSLAPRLETFGQEVLRKISEQRSGAAAGEPVTVRHGARTPEGWYVAETANFRIFHHQNRETAERAAQVAERTRLEMARKWLGEVEPAWNPRCDIYLHATAQDYSRATGVPANSPGHSTFHIEGGRVFARRIDLHCDDPNMLSAVLPHEATHVVLAGKFGDQPVPRWVDEGVAVLTEPREKVERHLRNLPQYRQDQQLFSVRQLMQLNDYPEPRYVSSFYAQSVSLVEFLATEKGPETFTRFVREGMRSGYEAALRRYYGFQDFNELEQRWRRHAFKEGVEVGAAAPR